MMLDNDDPIDENPDYQALMNQAIGRTIKDLRGKMSVDKFSVLIGVVRTNVYKMESGDKGISLKSVNSICAAFKITKEQYDKMIDNNLQHLKNKTNNS